MALDNQLQRPKLVAYRGDAWEGAAYEVGVWVGIFSNASSISVQNLYAWGTEQITAQSSYVTIRVGGLTHVLPSSGLFGPALWLNSFC